MMDDHRTIAEEYAVLLEADPPRLSSEELNKRLGEGGLADLEEFSVGTVSQHGKAVPYIGWYWRDVDFDHPFDFGVIPGSFVGFMENNKWGYGYVYPTAAACLKIRQLIEAYVETPTQETAQALNDAIQACG